MCFAVLEHDSTTLIPLKSNTATSPLPCPSDRKEELPTSEEDTCKGAGKPSPKCWELFSIRKKGFCTFGGNHCWQQLEVAFNSWRGRKELNINVTSAKHLIFPQLVLTPSPTALTQNHIFSKPTTLTSKVFHAQKNCPLNQDFRRATAGFPLFCLEILAGWAAISCLVQNTFWGWEKVTLTAMYRLPQLQP